MIVWQATEFSQSWDALNRFIGHFKLPLTDAMELRRFYLERRDMLAAQQRIRVCANFTPMMKERCEPPSAPRRQTLLLRHSTH